MKPRVLILRTAGTNCDVETAHAFELAGGASTAMHINRLLEDPSALERFDILAFPGGFSYGDDIASGRIFANQLMQHLREPLQNFVKAGKPVIGICNGFQVLVKTDLLPGPIAGHAGHSATLTNNDSGRFIDRWVNLQSVSKKCIWTRGIGSIELPIAHGEGKFIPASEAVRTALWENDQVALIYALGKGALATNDEINPNGSVDAIAGICDASGLVLGLMPHPERFVENFQHPAWTTKATQIMQGEGLRIFKQAIEHVESVSLVRH